MAKMTVQMLVSIAGHGDKTYDLEDFSFVPGQEVEIDEALAEKWIEGGLAVDVEDEEEEENGEDESGPETTALEGAQETTALKTAKPRKRGRTKRKG